MNFVAGAETDAGNPRFAVPVDAVCREVPFACLRRGAVEQCERPLARLHKRMVVWQGPRREDFIQFEDESSIAWLVILQEFHFYVGPISYDALDLIQDALWRLTESHAAVNKDCGLIWYGVDGWRLDVHVGYGDLAVSEKRIVAQFWLHCRNLFDDRQQLVNRVIAQMIACRMGTFTVGDYLHFDATLMSAINLHPGWLTDDYIIGANAFDFDQGVRRNTIAPLLHVAEVVGSIAIQQAKIAGYCQPVDHAGRAALLVARPPRKENAVLDLTDERIPLPLVRIADTYGVNVAVI